MPRFAANLTWMFNEHTFVDRFKAAADAGFKAVEIQLPYDHSPELLAQSREAAGVRQIMFNAPPGNMKAGEYGIAALPGRESEFRASIDQALEYAQALECSLIHVLAGIVPGDTAVNQCWSTYLENVAWAADHCMKAGVGVLLEPINAVERPGYLVSLTTQARDAVDHIGRENVGIQYDFHNAQLMEGRLTKTLKANIDKIRHMQVAGLPDRTPPDQGEMNFSYLFDLVDELGYEGWIGCEYRPGESTLKSLGWARPYGIG